MVHLNVFGPLPKPVTVLAGFEGYEIVPVPLTNVQTPFPTIAVSPEREAEFPQID